MNAFARRPSHFTAPVLTALALAALAVLAQNSVCLAGSNGDFTVNSATTRIAPDAPLYNVLTWPRAELEGDAEIVGYNVYRKVAENAPYPQNPINFQLLQVCTSCNKIKGLLGVNSKEWKAVQAAIAGKYLTTLNLQTVNTTILQNGQKAGEKKVVGPNVLTPYQPQTIFNSSTSPCKVSQVSTDSAAFTRLQLLAHKSWQVAVLLGQGYVDLAVAVEQTYYYEIRAVDTNNQETVLATDIAISTGIPGNLPAPTNLAAIPGDSRVLVHWDEVSPAVRYNVYRAYDANYGYKLINTDSVTAFLTEDFDGNPLPPGQGTGVHGFVDGQRWNDLGHPIGHSVHGQSIQGPADGGLHYYKVASVDILGNEGALSAWVLGVPADQAAPMAPTVQVIPDDNTAKIEVRWFKVTHDVEGHLEQKVVGYRIYRRDGPLGDPNTQMVQIGGFEPQPTQSSKNHISIFDAHDPLTNPLIPPIGEKHFWYHVEAEDLVGNVSALSTGVSGHLKDNIPPAPVENLLADGQDEYIGLSWDKLVELDANGKDTIGHYNIYRSVCDLGQWACISINDPFGKRCKSSFVFLGSVAQPTEQTIRVGWDDYSLPADSEICYAYLVKAVDLAQNESGSLPPDLQTEEIVCERLREHKPPPPAIISGIQSRSNGILVEWIGAPVQDIKAYHVYRSTSEGSGYQWVGGKTVPLDPNQQGQILFQPYDPVLTGCDTIPLVPHEKMSAGSFLDSSADPKRIYWYKVLGVDQLGNEHDPDTHGAPISTFTYSTDAPKTPTIGDVAPVDSPCGLSVSWTAPVDTENHLGYVVFRSASSSGFYRQVGSILTETTFLDTGVARRRTYWYKIAQIHTDGKISKLSNARKGKVN